MCLCFYPLFGYNYPYTHIHTFAYTHMHTHIHTYTYIQTHIHTCTYAHTHTHTHTHTYIHTPIHTHAHTNTYIIHTVQFNYNFKTWSMYTHGNPARGHTVHVSCLCGPRFASRVNMHFTCKIPCNTRGVAFHTRGVVFHTRGVAFYTRGVAFHTRGNFTCVASLAWPFQTCHFTRVEHGIVHVYYFGSNNSRCQ